MTEFAAPVEDFDKNGFALLRNVLDTGTVAKLREFCLAELGKSNAKLLSDVVVHHKEFRDLISRPEIVASMTSVLGPYPVILPPNSVDHNRFGLYHTDTSASEIKGYYAHRDPAFRIVVVGVYLQDNDEHGGGLRLVPGSHVQDPDIYVKMLRDKARIRAEVDSSPVKKFLKRISGGRLFSWNSPLFESVPGEVDVPTKAGDVLFWDMRIIHRASPRLVDGGVPGGKIAIFYTIARDNPVSRSWYDYWKSEGHLAKERSPGVAPPPPDGTYQYL